MLRVREYTVVICGLLSLFCVSGCQTYATESRDVRVALYGKNYSNALAKIDASSLAKSSSDRVLYLMERGAILYLKGDFREAAQQWDLALRRIDELYTVSISRQASSFLVNEMVTDYEGEIHERVLLPVFSALAFLSVQDPKAAIVEARRTARILDEISDKYENKNSFQRDGFAHWLTGVIFEMRQEWDSALIEYRRALEATSENKKWASDLQVDMFVRSLGTVAARRNRSDILKNLERDYPSVKWPSPSVADAAGELIVIYECGKAPLKKAEDIVTGINNTIIRISYPTYVDEYYASRSAKVIVDGNVSGSTVVVEDVGALARQALSDRRPKYIAKMVARGVAKAAIASQVEKKFGPLAGLAASAAGAITETADTRGWNSLPDLIAAARVSVPAGKKTSVRIVPDYGEAVDLVLELAAGEKRIVRLRTFE